MLEISKKKHRYFDVFLFVCFLAVGFLFVVVFLVVVFLAICLELVCFLGLEDFLCSVETLGSETTFSSLTVSFFAATFGSSFCEFVFTTEPLSSFFSS